MGPSWQSKRCLIVVALATLFVLENAGCERNKAESEAREVFESSSARSAEKQETPEPGAFETGKALQSF